MAKKPENYSFKDYLKKKGVGVDIDDSLAGNPAKKTDFSYPNYPERGLGTSKPLPYKNPDDQNGDVLVARDTDNKKPSLASMGTPGIDNYGSGLKKAKPQIRNPDPVKELKESTDYEKSLVPIFDLFGNQFTPEPHQTIQYIISIISNSPRMMDRFVIETLQRGCFGKLLECIMQHQGGFDELVNMFGKEGSGKEKSRQLSKSLHDKYVSALNAVDFSESADASVDSRFSAQTTSVFGSSNSPSQKTVFGDKGGMQATGDTFAGQGMPSTADNSPPPDFGTGPLSNPMKKLMKAETAAGNLFNSSASFSPLRSVMEEACKSCL